MNKEKVIKELEKKLNFSKDECVVINEVFENHFIVGKNNKEKIIDDLKSKLSISENEADNIYNSFFDIFVKGVKDKIKNPFKD